MLAGVLLAKRAPGGRLAIDGQEERLLVLLTVAQGKPVSPDVIRYIKRAGQLFAEVSDADLEYADYPLPRPQNTSSGNDFPAITKLTMMLALSGFTCEGNPRAHLVKALDIMNKGMSPGALLKALTKDDSDDDDNSDDDGSDDDDDSNDNSDDDSDFDFDAKHPRWPAGSPGGKGGEFAPKGSGSDSSSPDANASPTSWYERNEDWIVPAAVGTAAVGVAIATGGAALPAEAAEGTALFEEAESAAAATEGAATAEDTGWTLGDFKSDETWANQMASRGWTPEQIDEVIENGEQFPAPNNVNPGNPATRYMDLTTGRFVVMDNATGEILQISGDNFEPLKLPANKINSGIFFK